VTGLVCLPSSWQDRFEAGRVAQGIDWDLVGNTRLCIR